MIATLGRVRSVVFQMLSARTFCVPSHWVGRTVPCPGEDCPYCSLRSARRVHYAGLDVSGRRDVYEISDSLVTVICRAANMPDVLSRDGSRRVAQGDLRGVVVSASRDATRAEWQLVDAGLEKLRQPAVMEPEIAGAVASMFRLSKPFPSEGFVEWFERARVSQAEILRGSVLSFVAEDAASGGRGESR